jgi:hypothetical protein
MGDEGKNNASVRYSFGRSARMGQLLMYSQHPRTHGPVSISLTPPTQRNILLHHRYESRQLLVFTSRRLTYHRYSVRRSPRMIPASPNLQLFDIT